MEFKKATLCSLLLVLFIFASKEAVPGVEARVCELPSGSFKGLCVSDTNCAEACISEGFGGGNCEGLRRRCMCQKPC